MIIVDSSVIIDFLVGKTDRRTSWIRQHGDKQRIGLTSLTLCEVLRGVRSESHATLTERNLSKFEIFEIGSTSLATSAARNFRLLRGLGFTVRGTMDCLIATFCIEEKHILLHNDRDFDVFEIHLGLSVLHPPDQILH